MRTWFNMIAAETGSDSARIDIYDEIGGWGISAKDFAASLAALGPVAQLDIHIHSPGGDVFDGTAIYNQLKQHTARKVVTIDGLAASMASVVAMAGDVIRMPENALMMIHNPWTIAMGGADELRKNADLLDKIAGQLRGAYSAKSGMSDDDVRAMMDAETWLTGTEAVEKGLADESLAEVKLAAKLDLSKLGEHIDARAVALCVAEGEANERDEDPVPPPAEDPPPPPPDGVTVTQAEYDAAIADAEARGRADRTAEVSAELTAIQARVDGLLAQIAAANSANDQAVAKIAEQADTIAKLTTDLQSEQQTRARLLAGMQFTSALTWPEALAKYGYVEARRKHPAEYEAFMVANRNRK